MKFTNNYGIKSRSVVDALIHNDYDLSKKAPNIFSATEILDAPKNKVLTARHFDELVVDVSDNFHMMDGSAVHYVMERSNKQAKRERLSEERLYIRVPINGGEWQCHTAPEGERGEDQEWYVATDIYVSGKFDNFEVDEGIVEDYKRTSVNETLFGLRPHRFQQLNIGALGLILLGFKVNLLRSCLDLKDWSASDWKGSQRNDRYYPPIKYKEYEETPWPVDKMKEFVLARVMVHIDARLLKDDEIPECDKEERWVRKGKVKIFKKGGKRAETGGVFDDTDDGRRAAEQMLQMVRAKKPGVEYDIVEFPGNDNRCNGDKVYCHCRKWCHYWRENYQDKCVTGNEYEDL